MNHAHKKDMFTFYEKGILQAIESGERSYHIPERQQQSIRSIFESLKTDTKQVFLAEIKKQRCELKGVTVSFSRNDTVTPILM